MVNRVISFALHQRLLVIAAAVLMSAIGVWSILNMPIDSFPDVSNVQVQIITQPESMATEEIESLITFPIENSMNGLPKVKKVRSSSSFGLSVVTAIFEDDTDVYFARQLVQQRLLQTELPANCPKPMLGPVVSSFSQVLMYCLSSTSLNLTDLRTIQDWQVARKLKAVPGVANVVSYGGFVKQYQVLINPYKLRSYNLSLSDVMQALTENNINVGGNFIEQSDEEVIIRGLGRITSIDDVKLIVLKEKNGIPVLMSSVGDVVIGQAFRRESASCDGLGEAVTGIVLTRKSVNTKAVVENVKLKIKEIGAELPKGVKIEAYYDQTELVDKTIDTVKEILIFSGGLVIIILTAVLLHIPSALIVAVIIPLSLLFSFILMKATGLSANLMTLGAVDFGVIVDAGVVMVENIYRHLAHAAKSGQKPANLLLVVKHAAQEVGRPIVFAITIIVAVYIPLFTLEGVEGKMFHPLALTFIYALIGSLIVSLTVIPVLCFWIMRGHIVEHRNPVVEWVKARYAPALRFALENPKLVVVSACAALLGSLCLIPFLGSEFIPSLDEGPILLRIKLPASITHTNSMRMATAIEKMMMKFPEVETIVSRTGRSGTGPGFDGVESTDMFMSLHPKDKWTTAKTKEQLVDQMAAQMKTLPGIMFSFSQPIADMIDDLIAGIRADLGIKVFGDDVNELNRIASQIRHEVAQVRGAVDIQQEQMIGLPQLKISIDRRAIARYGLNVSDVQDTISAALAGNIVSEVIEDTRRFGVLVRYQKDYRDTPEQIRDLFINTIADAAIPLKQLADISQHRGLVMINREDGQRRTAVLVNVRGRDLGSFVTEAQNRVKNNVQIPKGYKVIWSGQFENQQRAMSRLTVVVPMVLVLIFLLLFASFNSIKNAGLIMLNVPFSMIGGIIALFISRQTLSVPAIIGFIALFGVAVQNGVILVSYIMQLQQRGTPVELAITQGAMTRLRPVLMTALVATVGLIPKIVSPGTGAEVQRPLATVVLGGLISATLLTLIVLPSLYKVINKEPQD